MKTLHIILLITGVALFLALAGCGGSGGDEPEPTPPDTVAVDPPVEPPLWPWEPENWAKLYPMDSLSPLLPPWFGKWVSIGGIDYNGNVYERPLSLPLPDGYPYKEFLPNGRMNEYRYNGEVWDWYYALDSLYLFTKDPYDDPGYNIVMEKYTFLEDSILRLDLIRKIQEGIPTAPKMLMYQRIKD